VWRQMQGLKHVDDDDDDDGECEYEEAYEYGSEARMVAWEEML